MEFEQGLRQQIAYHPSMKAQDVVKLCYQAAFGAEHLLQNERMAKKLFRLEFCSVAKNEGMLFEQISVDICRVNLAVWKKRGLPPLWLFRMFSLSISDGGADREGEFLKNLKVAERLLEEGVLPFSKSDWQDYQQRYMQEGIQAVHHSETYRREEHPSYRIVNVRYLRLFPLLEKLATFSDKKGAYCIAIDGRAASGKTTIASQLEEILMGGVIHMDDFFLPKELRTEKRFAQLGGNVHYERFLKEIIPNLSRCDEFSYQRFDCKKMDYGEWRKVPKTKWHIVEGSYSCHPVLGRYMDLRVFSDITEQEQRRRILAREDVNVARMFMERWIPLEEAYFSGFCLKEHADMVL
ncbi:MAG: hypothetical protein WCR02_07215 [Sphaerochaetaceae bacterium]